MWLALVAPLLAGEVAPKIINGEDATVDDWPQSGALLVEAAGSIALQCSSSLIAPDTVILAAHCIDPAVVGVKAFDAMGWSREPDLTAYQQATDYPGDVVMGTEWVFHDDWNISALQTGLALNYDIGLLFLEEPQTDIPLAWLPTAEEASQIVEGATVSVVGWGMDDAADTTSYGVKHFGDSTIDALADYEFQVGAPTESVRKCHGDSGGPTFLTVETAASIPVRMIGVTSHAFDDTDCAETGGVDTRVDYYLDWIDATMRAACEDGTRAWCDLPGILPPPVPMSEAELLEDVRLVGCASGGGRPGAWLVALAGLGFLPRWRRSTRPGPAGGRAGAGSEGPCQSARPWAE